VLAVAGIILLGGTGGARLLGPRRPRPRPRSVYGRRADGRARRFRGL